MDHRITEHSTLDNLSDVSWVQKAALQLYRKKCATPPHIHLTSKYIVARDQFYHAFPCVSTASDKHWVRRPGCRGEETFVSCKHFLSLIVMGCSKHELWSPQIITANKRQNHKLPTLSSHFPKPSTEVFGLSLLRFSSPMISGTNTATHIHQSTLVYLLHVSIILKMGWDCRWVFALFLCIFVR